ncbi:MAG: hypothetical protein ACU0AU_13710 [Cognatishimia activa]
MALSITAYTHADAWPGCADMIATIEAEARALGIACQTVDLAADPIAGEREDVSEIPTLLVRSQNTGKILGRKSGTANSEQVAEYLDQLARTY